MSVRVCTLDVMKVRSAELTARLLAVDYRTGHKVGRIFI